MHTSYQKFEIHVLSKISKALEHDEITPQEAMALLTILKGASDEQKLRLLVRSMAEQHTFLKKIFEEEATEEQASQDATSIEEVRSKLRSTGIDN